MAASVMRYFANPGKQGGPILAAMDAGLVSYIDTPRQGNARPVELEWCADNGCFSDKWTAESWWHWLKRQDGADSCRFAVAPDVVADAAATALRSGPWLEAIRELGFPVAYVLQDGQESVPVPWSRIDAVFIGGSDDFKLGTYAAQLVGEAKQRGLWAHMGRVNSFKRMCYADSIGCDSCDGTYLTFGPDKNLPKLLSWLDRVNTDRECAA